MVTEKIPAIESTITATDEMVKNAVPMPGMSRETPASTAHPQRTNPWRAWNKTNSFLSLAINGIKQSTPI